MLLRRFIWSNRCSIIDIVIKVITQKVIKITQNQFHLLLFYENTKCMLAPWVLKASSTRNICLLKIVRIMMKLWNTFLGKPWFSRFRRTFIEIILSFFGIKWIFENLCFLNHFWIFHRAEIIFKNAFFNTCENLNVFFYTKDKETNSDKLPWSPESNYLFSVNSSKFSIFKNLNKSKTALWV